MALADTILGALTAVNAVLWHDLVLYTILGVALLFTLWSGVGQYHALTHGVRVLRGDYDRHTDPGAVSHFQALSAALSATVGLGNIAGVAIAISLGGPGAVFWMWVAGVAGMALKMTEVTQTMLYRDLSEPASPHGGPMWVASRGLPEVHARLRPVGRALAVVFCLTLLVSTATGGNMFQAWNVADITEAYFDVPRVVTGVVLMVLVGLVIIGGIRRIGAVTGRLVPIMCGLYLTAGLYVVVAHLAAVPDTLRLIVRSAFSPLEAQGAFVGGAFGWVFLRGMQRALFSNEAGQGSSPIAHAAARTREPVREGIVAGLEPFVDTICVCSITALVILLSGIWNRPADLPWAPADPPRHVAVAPDVWSLAPTTLSREAATMVEAGDDVFAVVVADPHPVRGSRHHRLAGVVTSDGDRLVVRWGSLASVDPPSVTGDGVYVEYQGATLTARAFDRVLAGLGFWLVPVVAWLFALSTMISWSYYGEQGIVYLGGPRWVTPYRVVYCLLILVASSPLVRTEAQLDALSTLGTGVMLFANVPIILICGAAAMRAHHDYLRRLRSGHFDPGSPNAAIVV